MSWIVSSASFNLALASLTWASLFFLSARSFSTPWARLGDCSSTYLPCLRRVAEVVRADWASSFSFASFSWLACNALTFSSAFLEVSRRESMAWAKLPSLVALIFFQGGRDVPGGFLFFFLRDVRALERVFFLGEIAGGSQFP